MCMIQKLAIPFSKVPVMILVTGCLWGHSGKASEQGVQIHLRPDKTKAAIEAKSKKEESGKTTKHALKEDETLWFLAQVYYGKPSEFSKILSANGLSSTRELKRNQVLVIPNPKYDPQDSAFQKRFESLHAKRKAQLEQTKNHSGPKSPSASNAQTREQSSADKKEKMRQLIRSVLNPNHPARQAHQELEEK